MSFSGNSEHGLVPGKRQRPNILEARRSNEPRIKGKEQDGLPVAELLESAVSSGKLIPRISADNERFYPDISKGSESYDLVLWACFHQPICIGYALIYLDF